MIKPESVLQARRPVKLNVAVLLFQYGDAALKLLLLAGAESETDRGIQHRRGPPRPRVGPLLPGEGTGPPRPHAGGGRRAPGPLFPSGGGAAPPRAERPARPGG